MAVSGPGCSWRPRRPRTTKSEDRTVVKPVTLRRRHYIVESSHRRRLSRTRRSTTVEPGWEISYATGCKLVNFPDKEGAAGSQLVPEVAAGFPTITNNGKTYTFTIRTGYRFNTGQAVTAKSFVDTFNRNANPKLQSPVAAFMDVIVGARP